MRSNNPGTKTIIFSKNRACQLELLLRSITIPASVLYTYDSDFMKGYKKVIKMYPEVKFIKQTNFKNDLLNIIGNSKYILFLADDDVFISSFDWNYSEFMEFSSTPNIATLSLALSPRVAGKKWKWADYCGNYKLRMWGYPMSVDSCIFRKEDIIKTIQNNKINNLNQLETHLNLNIPNRPLMACLKTPVIVNNSANQVQTDFPAHTYGIPTSELEENFLKGKRLSLSDIKRKANGARYYRMKVDYKYE